MYNYGSIYGGAGAYSARLNAASDRYSEANLIGASRYLNPDASAANFSAYDRSSSFYSGQTDALRHPSTEIGGTTFPMSNGYSMAPAVDPTMVSGVKRPAEALYQQTILGTHNAIGQSEALFSTNSFAKHPRIETASNLHSYPQRPGEKDCPHYMMTRICKFGALCKFDHPLWIPEGGIPDWKEIPVIHTGESLPERPGEPDCPYYMKTQICKFGPRCKFNHPKDISDASASGAGGEHLNLQTPSTGQDLGSMSQQISSVNDNVVASGDSKSAKPFVPFTPALLHNSKGLPIRPGETDCSFYLKTGSCKYGATCRYNHPERNEINPSFAPALGHAITPSPLTNLPIGVLNPAANFLPNMDPRLTQTSMPMDVTIYPQRPGQLECDFYMKTGRCQFGERCKFHHPIDRSVPRSQEQNVKLTLAGLPRREDAVACSYYMKTGACSYGVKCRFDHPTPGEAIAMATTMQGSGTGNEDGAEEDRDAATEKQ